jgi:hypothetical protein
MENGTVIQKKFVAATHKISLQHSKIICYSIKKTIATWRKQKKGVRNSKKMGLRYRLLQP